MFKKPASITLAQSKRDGHINSSALEKAEVANGTGRCGRSHQPIDLQRLGNDARACSRRLPALFAPGLHRRPSLFQFGIGDGQMNAPPGNVDFNGVALFDQADAAAFCGFRGDVAD